MKTLDKYEYNLKLDEIKKLVTSGNYEEAVKVADTVEWKRVRNTRTLCMVSEIYEANGRLEDSKEILLRAYRRSQMTRTILFRLTEVAIKMKEFDEAVEYYSEFVNAAPNDTSRYILKYEIYKGRGSSLEDQIAILEEYKEAEYTEQWGYELAKLYYQAGEKQKCIESCDDLVLWFRQGKYVIKALELKRSLTELTPMQQTIYDHRDENLMPIKERVEAAVPELEKIIVDKMPSNETDAITENIISETQKELAQAVSQHTAAAEQETPEQQDQSWRYSTGGTTRVMPADAVRNNLQTDAPAAASAGAAEAVPQEPEAPDQAFDAQQLQKELAESMREIISGIHPAETEAEIVEPKNDMSFFRDRAGNVPVQEPKESIDDILVSMSGADETASTEEKEPEREMPEMPDLQVENEQPKEAVQPSGEERIPAPQAAVQNPGMASSGFAALEAQAAKMRAEAEQAAGLNERLAAHAGVNAAAEKKVEMPGTTAPDMASGTLENSQTEKKTAAQPQVPVKKPEQAAREQRIQSGQQSQAGQPVMSQPAQGQQQAAAGVPQQSSADQKAARVSQAQGVIRMERAGRNTEAAVTQQNPYQQAAYRPNQSLTLSQQQLFSYFSTIQGLQEQIACAMKETLNKLQKDKTSRSGNLVITGDPGSGRTTLGIRFAKALCQERGNSAARVAKIYAEDFNKKDIASTVAKIAGGTLIIEEAGDLSEESILTAVQGYGVPHRWPSGDPGR